METLEKRVLDNFLSHKDELTERALSFDNIQGKWLSIPVRHGMVIDQAIWDVNNKKWDRIEYMVGVGEGVSFEGEEDNFAHYDKTEKRTLKL